MEITTVQDVTTPSEPLDTLPTKATAPYWQVATSDNTRKAYQSDIRHFRRTGGLLPATTEGVLSYLQQHAPSVNPRTLKRRLVAIKQWHHYQNFPDPTAHPLVKKTVRGIARTYGKPADKAPALSVEHLLSLHLHLSTLNTLSALRDNALLQVGFFGAFRRSELTSIEWQHINFVLEGVEILIPRSKTDAEGVGTVCAIPYGHSGLCPVLALKQWQEQSAGNQGFVFRAIRQGKCDSNQGLSPATVNQIIKRHARECGLPNAADYSGHSLRRGFATSAAQNGASLGAIMRQGRWQHEATVHGYIQEGTRFEANAAARILENTITSPTVNEEMHG